MEIEDFTKVQLPSMPSCLYFLHFLKSYFPLSFLKPKTLDLKIGEQKETNMGRLRIEEIRQVLSWKTEDVLNSARQLFKHNDETLTSLTSQISKLREENGDLRLKFKTTQEAMSELQEENAKKILLHQEAITKLEQENAVLCVKLETALSKEEITNLEKENAVLREKLEASLYKEEVCSVRRLQFVQDTLENFRVLFGDWNPANEPEINLRIENESEAVDSEVIQSPGYPTPNGKETTRGEGHTPQSPGSSTLNGKKTAGEVNRLGHTSQTPKKRPHLDPYGTPRATRAKSRLATSSGSQTGSSVSG